MLPDRVSNPGPLTYESGALPIALRGPAQMFLQDMYHIIFLFRKIYLSIRVLISVCTGRSYNVTTERAHVVVSILTSKM